MNICIFCSAYEVDEKYNQPAEELAALLAKNGHHLVWGGSSTGMMGRVASAFKQNGGKTYGVSIEAYKEVTTKDADELIMAKDLGARKAAMLGKSDAILVFPGGIGTLDELTEILELKKQGHHDKPIVILSINGFYASFIKQLEKMHAEGFTPINIHEMAFCTQSPKEAEAYIDKLAKK